ncbi:elongation factor Ts [Candidatus Poribacteria bacterium]|nr:elongation factor Ts [Candidatus Poribacteria bacterium]
MAVSATLVKELREKTSVGMMECKKALEEANGDMDAAIRVLRERGIAKAAKREGRTAAEGLVGVAVGKDMKRGAVTELNSETDFVARNDEFAALAGAIAQAALDADADSVEAVNAASIGDGRTVATAVEDIRTKIGEKIEVSTSRCLSGDVVTGYVHLGGKIGVLVSANAPGLADGNRAALAEGLREIAMHVAAYAPRFLDDSQVDAATLAAEREIYAVLARNEGKPEAIIPKIVDGKVKAFYKDNCLIHQAFAKDPAKTVSQVLQELSKAAGSTVTLRDYIRVQVGAKV